MGPVGPRRSSNFPRERDPRGTSDTTTTHILVFIGDFTWILALLSGKVDDLASQICQGILHNVGGVGGAGDSDVMLKRPLITWSDATGKGDLVDRRCRADGQRQEEPRIGQSQRREEKQKGRETRGGGGERREEKEGKKVKIKAKRWFFSLSLTQAGSHSHTRCLPK